MFNQTMYRMLYTQILEFFLVLFIEKAFHIYITLDSTAEIKHIVNAYIGAVISLSSSPFPPTSICLLLFVEVVLSPLCCAGTCLFL